jgi:methionyl-tRNA formyltransferase
VSYAAKISGDDARVRWDLPAFAVDRQIRGCTPKPGAWTMLGELSLKLGPITATDESTLRPGELAVGKREVRVGTGTTDVVLGTVQPPGKKPMVAADWGRGLRLDGRTARFA